MQTAHRKERQRYFKSGRGWRYLRRRSHGSYALLQAISTVAVFMAISVAPPNALRGGVSKITKDFWPCEKGGKWIDIEDHRGEEGYITGSLFTVFDLGPYPEEWRKEPLRKTDAEKAAEQRAEIESALFDIDHLSIRPLRAAVDGSATEFDRKKIQQLEEEAAKLRTALAALPV